jgi:hypothetical protein
MGGDWKPAKAKVKARRQSSKFPISFGAGGTSGLGRKRWEYVVDVSPSDGDAQFTATMVTPMLVDHWRPLNEGDVVTVLHKPGTEEVKWDKSEPSTSRRAQWKALQQSQKRSKDQAFDAALHAGPGNDPNDDDEDD